MTNAPGEDQFVGPVRPSPGSQVKQQVFWWAGATVFVLIGIPVSLQFGENPMGVKALIVDVPIVIIATAFGAVGLLYLRNERIGLDSGYLYRVNPFGIRRRWLIKDLLEVVRMQAISGGDPEGNTQRITVYADLVIDKHGKALASFADWPRGAMTRIWRTAGLPIHEPWSNPVGVHEIRHRYPGALPALPEDYDQNSPRSVVRYYLLVVGAIIGLFVLAIVAFVAAVIVAALRG